MRLWIGMLVVLRWGLSAVPVEQDARALASAITRATTQRFRELVFVELAPRYGLSLYLDAEVEQVEVEVRAHARGFAATPLGCSEEFAANEPDRLVFIPSDRLAMVHTRLVCLGWEPRLLGSVHGVAFLELAHTPRPQDCEEALSR